MINFVGGVLLSTARLWAAADPRLQADPAQRAAEAIERALQRHAPDVHRCFERALADRLDVAGDIEVEVEVGREGKVTAAKLLPPPAAAAGIPAGTPPPAELVACVEQAARGFVLGGIEPGAAVVLPFSFQGQVDQFAVKVADVPERGPRPPGAKRGGDAAGTSKRAPFSVKVLIDAVNARTPRAALTLLTVAPRSRVAMHRHPTSAKALYALSGRARVLGPPGAAPLSLDPGTAVFVPPGHPHVIETVSAKEPAVLLQIFTPPGPEQVYRDPTSAEARAAFEVVRDGQARGGGTGAPATGTAAVAVSEGAVKPTGAAGAPQVRVLLDAKTTGRPDLAFALAVVEFPAGTTLARHAHEGSSELMFVAAGGGTLQVGSEVLPFGAETALYLPAGQPHGATFAAAGPTRVIQILAPGPQLAGAPAAQAR